MTNVVYLHGDPAPVEDNARRLDRMRVVMEDLQQTEAISSRAKAFPPEIALRAVQREGR